MERLVKNRTTEDLKAEVLDAFMRPDGRPAIGGRGHARGSEDGLQRLRAHALLQILVATAQDAEMKPSHVLVFMEIGNRLMCCQNDWSLIESMAGIVAQRRAMVAVAMAKRAPGAEDN